MSTLDERPLGKLFDLVLQVLWQDQLQVWQEIRKRLDSEGTDAVRSAFEEARGRLLNDVLEDHIEVRWGMNLCPLCNDSNVEKNGIAYVAPNGDGLEFNQCLNCRIGILYALVSANATMDTYTIGLGAPDQFNGMSFYWDAVVPTELGQFWPLYEIIQQGQWLGTVSFDESVSPRYLPFSSMKHGVPRGSADPWTTDIPDDVRAAIDEFLVAARHQVEVALALRP